MNKKGKKTKTLITSINSRDKMMKFTITTTYQQKGRGKEHEKDNKEKLQHKPELSKDKNGFIRQNHQAWTDTNGQGHQATKILLEEDQDSCKEKQ
jgi:hypothetical protein